MLKIVGYDDGSKEWKAAQQFQTLVLQAFPNVAHSEKCELWVFPSVKTPWHKEAKDIDLYVLGRFHEPLTFRTKGGDIRKCWSLSLSIEVKSHTDDGAWLVGDKVWVSYDGGPEPATEQSFKQTFAMQSYYERKGFHRAPFIRNFVWLNRIDTEQFGEPDDLPDDVIFADTSFPALLRKVHALQGEYDRDVSFLGKDFPFEAVTQAFSKVLVPSRLARERVERITKSRYKHKSLKRLGDAQIAFSGYGGAGKTAILLRTAKDLYEQGKRCLILTYHTALTSDLYRQLQIMQLRQNAFGESVNIETLHRFFRRWLIDLQEVDQNEIDDEWFDDAYYGALSRVNAKIARGEITHQEIQGVKNDSPALYRYDHVFVDEAQDWHDEERTFLYNVYDPRCLVLSLGDRQLVRSDKPTDWTPPAAVEKVASRLAKCLRLTPNIAHFVTGVARALGDTEFSVVSDDDMRGGNVHVVVGEVAQNGTLIDHVLTVAHQLGNDHVDHLFCVPPETVQEVAGKKRSRLGQSLEQMGYCVYDAVDREVRMGIPNSNEDLRIVQYDSCRGLEGWAVFLEALDIFYDHKREHALRELAGKETLSFLKEQLASARALDWTLIPLTRAIDTLVISIANPRSDLGTAVLKVAFENADFVRVHAVEIPNAL